MGKRELLKVIVKSIYGCYSTLFGNHYDGSNNSHGVNGHFK